MTLLPKLLAIVAMILPLGNGKTSEPVRLALSSPLSIWVHDPAPPSPIFTAPHLPRPTESFFERFDEMAYDEEDSTRVEDHGIVPLTLLDYGAPLASRSLFSLAPAGSHTAPVVIMPVLRC
jgi:hypothetical protein